MPFALDEVPERLRGKNIPAHFIRLFIHVWNSVWEKTHDEESAWKQAYGVLRQALEKAGYRRDENGVWHKEEANMEEERVLEGWLPEGISENDLDDGDFAWLSHEYQRASPEERAKMNKRKCRKLPFKIHGKVNREGWKAAWKAAAWHSAREPDWSGGPSKEETLALLRRYKPRGIKINKDNTFTDEGEGAEEEATISVSNAGFTVVEEVEGGLRFIGVALVDNALSTNGRYYSREFNDRCMEATNQYIVSGGTVTIYSRHGRAIPPVGELPRYLPIGRVTEPLYREGKEIRYKAFIAPTTEGRDVITLIKTGVMRATSIRAVNFKSKTRRLNGQVVEELLDAVIEGIDLTDEAGIRGAGICEILEEKPVWEEEEKMDWQNVTLEDLVQNCPQILADYVADIVAGKERELEEKYKATLEEANAKLQEALAKTKALGDELATMRLSLRVAEAAHIGSVPKFVAEKLRDVVKSEEDVGKYLPDILQQAFRTALNEERGAASGKVDVPQAEQGELSPEQMRILKLAAI